MCLYSGEVEDVLDIVGVESLMLTKVFTESQQLVTQHCDFDCFFLVCVEY